MQRRMLAVVLACLSILLIAAGSWAAGESLLKNGSFSEGMTGWGLYRFSGTAPVTTDEQGLRITTPSDKDRLTVTQRFKHLGAGQLYKLTAKVKTEGVEKGRGGYIRVQFKNSSGKSVGSYPTTKSIVNSPDWQELSLDLTPPDGTAEILVELFMEYAQGTIWFTDVQCVVKEVQTLEIESLSSEVMELGAVRLDWALANPEEARGAISYQIFRSLLASQSPDAGAPLAVVEEPTFVDRTVKGGRSYYYMVVPQVQAKQETRASKVLAVTVGSVEPGLPPVGAQATPVADGVAISWEYPQGARIKHVDIYRLKGELPADVTDAIAQAVYVSRSSAWQAEYVDRQISSSDVDTTTYLLRAVDPEQREVGDLVVPITGIIRKRAVEHGFEHPYLVVTLEEIQEAKALAEADFTVGLLLNMDIKQPADTAAKVWKTPQALPAKNDRGHAGLASTARKLGLAHQFFPDNPAYVDAARNILLTYADKYKSFPKEASYGGRVTKQTLEEAGFLIQIAWAYDLIYNQLTVEERQNIEKNLIREAADIIKGSPRGLLNWQVWHDAALAAAGFVLQDENLIDDALFNNLSVSWQVKNGLLADGMWFEQSVAYHMYTLQAFSWLAIIADHGGYDVFGLEYGGRSFKSMYDAPFYHAFTDLTHPSVGDNPATDELKSIWFYGPALNYYGDPNYAWLLRQGALANLAYPAIFFVRTLRETPATDFAVGTNQFSPLGQNTLGSTLFGDMGMTVMRGSVAAASPGAALIYKPYGTIAGHQHADNLSLYLDSDGHQWLAGSGKFDYYPGQEDNRHGGYARHTVAKNTLVIDGKSQYPQRDSNGMWESDRSKGKTSRGQLDAFVPGPTMQLTRATSSEVYPGVSLTRTVLVTDTYVLDLYDAVGDAAHQYDWVIHIDGTVNEGKAAFADVTGTLGERDGNQYVNLAKRLAGITSPLLTSWENGTKSMDHWFVPGTEQPGEVLLGKALWTEGPGERPVFIGRSNSKQARFASVFAPGSGKVTDVKWLAEGVNALQITHASGVDTIKVPSLGSSTDTFSVVRLDATGSVSDVLLVKGMEVAAEGFKIATSKPASFSAGKVNGYWVLSYAGPARADLSSAGIDLLAADGSPLTLLHPGQVYTESGTVDPSDLVVTMGK